MTFRWIPVAMAAAVFLSFGEAAHAAAIPTSGELDFTVLRDGDKVGTETLHFAKQAGGAMDVDIKTNVEVSMMFVTVYRFEQRSHEHWNGNRLASLTSTTNDDGTKHDLTVTTDGDGLKVADNGVAKQLPTDLLPASLWNDGIVAAPQATLLNTLDGTAMKVKVADLGTETVDVGSGQVTAHHYALSGDLKREVWYDPQGVLVKVRFAAKDGSDIQYVLR